MNFGGLAVEVSWHDPFPKALQAVHPGPDLTSDMLSCPFRSERPAQVSGCGQILGSRDGGGSVDVPGTAVTADGYDPFRASLNDRTTATSCVIGAVGGDGPDRFAGRDLYQQFRK